MNKTLNLNNKGYTLIELLAVMIVLITTGTIITAILVTSLRGGNKGNIINDARQNGNAVMSQMSKMIAYARTFCGVSIDNNEGTAAGLCDVNGANGSTYITNCISSPSTQYNYIRVLGFDGGKTIFSCHNNTIASNGASLIDSTKLKIINCAFYCSQDNLSASQKIDIDFTITTATVGLFSEGNVSIPFQTSVTPRN